MLDGPYLAGCLLLVAAGIAKFRRPADTARAVVQVVRPNAGTEVARVSLGPAVLFVRALAAVELAIGLAGLWAPSVVSAGLVAASYVGFSGFVVAALVRGGPLATCGCFSRADTPPTVTHVLLTLGFAAGAATVAATFAPGRSMLWGFLAHQPLAGVPMLLSSLALAVVAWLAMTLLPSLRSAR